MPNFAPGTAGLANPEELIIFLNPYPIKSLEGAVHSYQVSQFQRMLCRDLRFRVLKVHLSILLFEEPFL
jgi:hypothetical protein